MEPIKPIPTETLRLAARHMEREAAKINAIGEMAKRNGFPQMMERTIRLLGRL